MYRNITTRIIYPDGSVFYDIVGSREYVDKTSVEITQELLPISGIRFSSTSRRGLYGSNLCEEIINAEPMPGRAGPEQWPGDHFEQKWGE